MSIEYMKLYKFIEENEEIMSYINKLMKTNKVIEQMRNKPKLEKLQELGANYIEKIKQLEEIMQKINDNGLQFSNDNLFHLEGFIAKYEEDSSRAFEGYGHYSIDHNYEYCFFHDADWLNEKRVSYPTTISGYSITKEKLEDEKTNHTSQKEYEKWLKENSNLSLELKELESEIEKDLKLLNKKLFGKKQIKERLSANKEKLLELNDKKIYGDNLKAKAAFYENLDSNQKSLIIEYLNLVEECNEITKDIKDYDCSVNMSCQDEMIYNADTLIREAVKYGVVTQEEVEKYNYILMNIDLSDVVLDKFEQSSYESGEHYWNGDYHTKKLIDSYCHMIMKLKMKKNFSSLATKASNKIKMKKTKFN